MADNGTLALSSKGERKGGRKGKEKKRGGGEREKGGKPGATFIHSSFPSFGRKKKRKRRKKKKKRKEGIRPAYNHLRVFERKRGRGGGTKRGRGQRKGDLGRGLILKALLLRRTKRTGEKGRERGGEEEKGERGGRPRLALKREGSFNAQAKKKRKRKRGQRTFPGISVNNLSPLSPFLRRKASRVKERKGERRGEESRFRNSVLFFIFGGERRKERKTGKKKRKKKKKGGATGD